MSMEPQRTCPSCGNEYSGAMEFCPVCMLRMGLAGGVESGESSVSKETVECIPERASQRFEHYELLKGADGKPVELGRGAMGVTYKAFDVDLRIPVTLKLISKNMSETNRRGFAFCGKPAQQPRCDIQTSLQFSILGEAAKATSTQWSS